MKKVLFIIVSLLIGSHAVADKLAERACQLDYDQCAQKFNHCQEGVQRFNQCQANNERCRQRVSEEYKECVRITGQHYDNCVHLNRSEHKKSRVCDKYNASNCKTASQVCPGYDGCGQMPSCGPVKERCDVNYQLCMRNANASAQPPQQKSTPSQPTYQAPASQENTSTVTPRYEQPAVITAPQTRNTKEQVLELSKAIGEEQYDEVNRLLQQGVAINAPDINNNYPICYAASLEHDNTRFVKLLLDLSARVNTQCSMVLYRSGKDAYGENEQLSVLQVAVTKRNLAVARMLLDNGADITLESARKGSALHIAAEKGDLEMVKLLLKYKADINFISKSDNSVLDGVDYSTKPAVANYLIEHGIDKNRVLLYGAKNGILPLVKKVLSRGADINATDMYKKTSLIWAVKNKHKDIIDYLLSKKADTNKFDAYPYYEPRNALYYAMETEQNDVIVKLVKHGADVDTQLSKQHYILGAIYRNFPYSTIVALYPGKKAKNWTQDHLNEALAIAAHKSDDIKVIQFLLNQGADVNSKDETPLKNALGNKNPEIAKYLASKGAGKKLTKNKDAKTLFEFAGWYAPIENIKLAHSISPQLPAEQNQQYLLCTANDVERVNLYVQYGFNINAVKRHQGEPDSETAIVCAVTNKNMGLFKAFLTHKADIKFNEKTQASLFEQAIIYSIAKHDFLDELIKQGADVNFQYSKNGFTPLHMAIEHYRMNIIKQLLQAGADKTKQNKDGKTPYDMAKAKNAPEELLSLLR